MTTAWMLYLAVILSSFPAQQARNASHWDSWRFLLGEWTAEGGGQPGQATGTFSFNFDLQGRILVRVNRANYPASNNHPAFSHEDLMVIYSEPGGATVRAIYFDNEGHVIHYTAEFSRDQKTLTFLSDPAPSTPRFRLIYSKGTGGTLKLKFEIAPPGKPESFSTYVEGVAHKNRTH